MKAIHSPLLEVGIEQATGIVWNITGPSNMTLFEVGDLAPLAAGRLCFGCPFLVLRKALVDAWHQLARAPPLKLGRRQLSAVCLHQATLGDWRPDHGVTIVSLLAAGERSSRDHL